MSTDKRVSLGRLKGKAPSAKLFYKISEVSQMTGVEPYVLRYWESEFQFLSPRKNSGGWRLYQKRDIETIISIKEMLYKDRYTIAGVKRRLSKNNIDGGDNKLIKKLRKELREILEEISS